MGFWDFVSQASGVDYGSSKSQSSTGSATRYSSQPLLYTPLPANTSTPQGPTYSPPAKAMSSTGSVGMRASTGGQLFTPLSANVVSDRPTMSTAVGAGYVNRQGELVVTDARPQANISTPFGPAYSTPGGQIFLQQLTASGGNEVRPNVLIPASVVPKGFSPDMAYTNIDVVTGRPTGVTFYTKGSKQALEAGDYSKAFGDVKFVPLKDIVSAAGKEGLDQSVILGQFSKAALKTSKSVPISLSATGEQKPELVSSKLEVSQLPGGVVQTVTTKEYETRVQQVASSLNIGGRFSSQEEAILSRIGRLDSEIKAGNVFALLERLQLQIDLSRVRGNPLTAYKEYGISKPGEEVSLLPEKLKDTAVYFGTYGAQLAPIAAAISLSPIVITKGLAEAATGKTSTLSNYFTGLGAAATAMTVGAADVASSFARGQPSGVAGVLAVTPGGVFRPGIGAAKVAGLPITKLAGKAGFTEVIRVKDVAPSETGLVLKGTIETATQAKNGIIKSVQDFETLVFPKEPGASKVPEIDIKGNFALQQAESVSKFKGMQETPQAKIKGKEQAPLKEAVFGESVGFSGKLAKQVEESQRPSKINLLSKIEEAVATPKERASPAGIDIGEFVGAERPSNIGLLRKGIAEQASLIRKSQEQAARGGVLSEGPGSLTGAMGRAKVGGKDVYSLGVSRTATELPRVTEQGLVQTYIAEEFIRSDSGKAKATGEGLVFIPKDIAAKLESYFQGGKEKGGGESVLSKLKDNAPEFKFEELDTVYLNKPESSALVKQVVQSSREAAAGGRTASILVALEKQVNAQPGAARYSFGGAAASAFAMETPDVLTLTKANKVGVAQRFEGGQGFITKEDVGVGVLGKNVGKSAFASFNDLKSEELNINKIVSRFSKGIDLTAYKPREEMPGRFKISKKTTYEFPSQQQNQNASEYFNRLEERFREVNRQTNTSKTEFRSEYGNRALMAFFGGGGGAAGDVGQPIRPSSFSVMFKRKGKRIVPRVDPLTQLQFQLKTGRTPILKPSIQVEKAFAKTLSRNPLLFRFPNVKVVEQSLKRYKRGK